MPKADRHAASRASGRKSSPRVARRSKARRTAAVPAPLPPPVRDRILAAGLALLREEGVGALSQKRVADAAGVRQSHVTYYFPRRPDLVAALAAAAVRRIAENERGTGAPPTLGEIASGIADISHMRMHLAMMVEADADPGLRAILLAATGPMLDAVSRSLGIKPDDPRTAAALAALWGAGMYRFLIGAAPAGQWMEALLDLVGRRHGGARARTR